ncbi:DNA-binding FadR family transcriptional regulator [Microbacterium terrae]|uniref:Pyruvate dehydrogenase complex repressor n=1 Tax=Microbacterium terrae TaxID=69369 RepID=A0A0M2H8U0_9MICO|nr:GntR family transcriptional regulator [Microbacterium terrae]KJL40559.1 Pyruvate dehydrogenase complex repressor [Microbacterium terrae]MBP1079116.1 DNA-binding FadR family transcriptional regulator [Microbacterium terrae]GLJ98517.1 GntR family transcriptional regulator [Microbacterium terrae]
MPHATGRVDPARAVVFAPLDGNGRAALVEQRLSDAIVSGILHDGERLPSESDLSRSFGVALVTAREALEVLRDKGLVKTRRGRDGGSFVTFDRESANRLLERRLREHSRIELRDFALHTAAIAGTAAETAAERASDDDIENLVRIDAAADPGTAGGARRALSRFQLEVAAISQSPRLVHEEMKLQSEAGPLLWMCLREQEYRDRSALARSRIIAAIRDVQPDAARATTLALIDDAFDWLVDERARIDETTADSASDQKDSP